MGVLVVWHSQHPHLQLLRTLPSARYSREMSAELAFAR